MKHLKFWISLAGELSGTTKGPSPSSSLLNLLPCVSLRYSLHTSNTVSINLPQGGLFMLRLRCTRSTLVPLGRIRSSTKIRHGGSRMYRDSGRGCCISDAFRLMPCSPVPPGPSPSVQNENSLPVVGGASVFLGVAPLLAAPDDDISWSTILSFACLRIAVFLRRR